MGVTQWVELVVLIGTLGLTVASARLSAAGRIPRVIHRFNLLLGTAVVLGSLTALLPLAPRVENLAWGATVLVLVGAAVSLGPVWRLVANAEPPSAEGTDGGDAVTLKASSEREPERR